MRIPAFIKKGFNFVYRHSTEIMVGLGCVGTVVAGVVACKATTNLPELEKEAVKRIEEAGDDPKELRKAKAANAISYAKNYAPAVFIEAVSLGSIGGGTYIALARNAALATAYASLNAVHNNHVKRVEDKYGKEASDAIAMDQTEKQITRKITDENGKTKTVKETVMVSNNLPSPYAKYWNRVTSRMFQHFDDPNIEYKRNEFTIKCQQNTLNDILRAEGRVYLNRAYRMLDLPETVAGNEVGWILKKDATGKVQNDGYIDLGYRMIAIPDENEVGGFRFTYIINPNVDGPINARCIEEGLMAEI